MVALRRIEDPFYKGIGRQRARVFEALAQINGRTAILLLCQYVFPGAKCVGADILEFTAPTVADVVSGTKNFKTAAKRNVTANSEKKSKSRKRKEQKAKKSLSTGNRQADSFERKLQNTPVSRGETF